MCAIYIIYVLTYLLTVVCNCDWHSLQHLQLLLELVGLHTLLSQYSKERVEEAYHAVAVAYIGWLTDNLLLKSALVLIKSPIEILQTVRDSNLVPKEMAYRESNSHVTDNVT